MTWSLTWSLIGLWAALIARLIGTLFLVITAIAAIGAFVQALRGEW